MSSWAKSGVLLYVITSLGESSGFWGSIISWSSRSCSSTSILISLGASGSSSWTSSVWFGLDILKVVSSLKVAYIIVFVTYHVLGSTTIHKPCIICMSNHTCKRWYQDILVIWVIISFFLLNRFFIFCGISMMYFVSSFLDLISYHRTMSCNMSNLL